MNVHDFAQFPSSKTFIIINITDFTKINYHMKFQGPILNIVTFITSKVVLTYMLVLLKYQHGITALMRFKNIVTVTPMSIVKLENN